jgi:hypothetical protein
MPMTTWSIPFRGFRIFFMNISLLIRTACLALWLHHYKNIRWRVQIVTFPIMQVSPVPLLLPLWIKIFSSTSCSQTPSKDVLSLNVRGQASHIYKTQGKVCIIRSVYINFYIFDWRREDKNSELNESKHSQTSICC